MLLRLLADCSLARLRAALGLEAPVMKWGEIALGGPMYAWADEGPQGASFTLLLQQHPGEERWPPPWADGRLLCQGVRRFLGDTEGVEEILPLSLELPVVPASVGEHRDVLALGGMRLEVSPMSLDEEHPSWGESPLLRGEIRAEMDPRVMLREVADLLAGLTLPLSARPQRREEALERPLALAEQRYRAAHQALEGAESVLDLGCGRGGLLERLLRDRRVRRVLAVDLDPEVLQEARDRLRLERRSASLARKLELRQSALTYRDPSLEGFQAACLLEVIEHQEPHQLRAIERNVFEFARPRRVVVTTPNHDYNPRLSLPPGAMRDPDHRFEWGREEFAEWAQGVARRYGLELELDGVGPVDRELGAPTLMAVFRR